MFISFVQSRVTRARYKRTVVSLSSCLAALLALLGCERPSTLTNADAVHGIRCSDPERPGKYGPTIYPAAILERADTRVLLRDDERREIRMIRRYIGENYALLHFTHLENRLIVFVSHSGDCFGGAPGYAVLNGYCNEYYEPGEMPNNTHPTPDCLAPRRPWYPKDALNKSLRNDPTYWRNERVF